ncbi:phd finger domain protein [Diplodia corticola]|uniref:Chromatin modification-related protein n=1 Tax=Diplodia corticola TaxID=236234 RepID=A0A1J9SJ72_9PEZI|nr:phd finger domain protein [Diplodia corticola]OJD40399.1 phd finger domain protein [Diplodia corticola]
MKASTIRDPAGSSSGPSRRQSARQQRTTATRPANYYARPFAPRGIMGGADNASTNTAAPGFFPAITHFTDTITALPKEVMKHFSMLKEVEAKTHQPDDELQKLAEQVSQLHAPTRREAQLAALNTANATGHNTANGSVADSVTQDQTPANQQQGNDLVENANNGKLMNEASVLARRELFLRYRYGLSQMCAMLDEKNAVLSSANQTMDKQLGRMESSFDHIDEELTFEARYGSFSHWAYKDGDEKKKTTNERSRREVAAANNLAAAAAAVHEGDMAASRSEARREALLAKQRNRNHYVDSEFEDSRPAKKPPTNRGKKAVEPVGPPDARLFGLGISNGPGQTTKRRKTEKGAAAAPVMERSLSGAMQNAQPGRASPRETPAAEGGKKRSRAAPAPAAVKKRYGPVMVDSVSAQHIKASSRTQALGAQSPQAPSSPVIGSFHQAGANAHRPQSSRARQNSATNSIHSNVQDAARNRPPSSASNRPVNGTANSEVEQAGVRASPAVGASNTRLTAEPPTSANGGIAENNMKREDIDAQDGSGTPVQTVVTRAGRTSKTATPVVGSFPSDVPMARSRSTRNNGSSHASSESNAPIASTQSQKRSHKKGASALQQQANTADDGSSLAGDLSGPDVEEEIADDDEDGDQERFCYCNGVSYGEMIGCDNPDCLRQWFHYACVGITKEPNKKAKWYCDDCKEKMKRSRPGSRQ